MIKHNPFWLVIVFDFWWSRQEWIRSPFSWLPQLAISSTLVPISLLWRLIDYLAKKLYLKEADNANK